MQLVVELPDEYYKALLNSSHVYLTMGGRGNGKTFVSTILVAVVNGTPLPKGHGRLIDADALDDTCEWCHTDDDGSWCYKCKDIDNAPTIIEAEEEADGRW